MNHHDLLFHQLAEAHEDRGDLGAGGVRLRAQLAVRTLNQALTNGPLHRGDGPRTDVGSVRKQMTISAFSDELAQVRTKKIAITRWLKERLKLDVSEEKTRIVNVKRRYSEFLGFKIKVVPKSGKLVVGSHISDKAWKRQRENLIEQAKHIAKATPHHTELDEIKRYNAMVMGVQNYYRIATAVSLDCKALHHAVMTVLANRLRGHNGRLVRKGRKLTEFERKRNGRSAMLRYVAGSDEPVYPIGFIQHKAPKSTKNTVNAYTPEGRAEIHRFGSLLCHRHYRQEYRSPSDPEAASAEEPPPCNRQHFRQTAKKPQAAGLFQRWHEFSCSDLRVFCRCCLMSEFCSLSYSTTCLLRCFDRR